MQIFFKSKDLHGSQFWKALHKVKHLFKWGAIHVVGDGKCTQFWNDVWITASPLRIDFPRIYDICNKKNISVAGCAQMDWHPHLRRMLDAQALVEWNQLQVLLQGVQLSTLPDQITWGLTKSKQFTTASLYQFLTASGVTSHVVKKIWKCKVPLKVRIFMWQAIQNRLQTTQLLRNKSWKRRDTCAICGASEDVDHHLFTCPMANFVWAFLREALGWDGHPSSMSELLSVWLPNKFGASYQIGLFCFAGLAWTLWTTRSKICMQKTFSGRPTGIIHLGLSFI
jgi:hypothetical protein